MKFTQEIKDNWIKALESGNYKQGYGELESTQPESDKRYCCIGVLGVVTEGLTNHSIPESNTWICPYNFLENSGVDVDPIWELNDSFDPTLRLGDKRTEGYKDDYSNIIEVIKALPVQI